MILLLLRISLSLLWLRSCNKDFYKDFENSNVDFEVNEHKDYNIPKQYSLIRKDNSRSPNGKEHCNLNVAPRLCHQFEKISVNSNTENRIKYHKKIQNACHLCWEMHKGIMYISFRTGKTDWSTFINSTNSFDTCSSSRFKLCSKTIRVSK